MDTSKDKQQLIKREKLKIIDWLIETFPQTFFKKGKQIKPLKIGILDDIFQEYRKLSPAPFSKKSLRTALAYYCASPAYLNAQKKGRARIDLYGNELEEVTAEQAKYAKQQYTKQYLTPAPMVKVVPREQLTDSSR